MSCGVVLTVRSVLCTADRLEKSDNSEEETESAPAAPPAAAQLTPDQIAARLEEQRREHERCAFIRDWDRGKQGVATNTGERVGPVGQYRAVVVLAAS